MSKLEISITISKTSYQKTSSFYIFLTWEGCNFPPQRRNRLKIPGPRTAEGFHSVPLACSKNRLLAASWLHGFSSSFCLNRISSSVAPFSRHSRAPRGPSASPLLHTIQPEPSVPQFSERPNNGQPAVVRSFGQVRA